MKKIQGKEVGGFIPCGPVIRTFTWKWEDQGSPRHDIAAKTANIFDSEQS